MKADKKLAPVELMVELFVVVAIFAALVASFLIVVSTLNSREAASLRSQTTDSAN